MTAGLRRTMVIFVLDLLYTQVVKAMGDTAIENKRKTAQAFRMIEQP